MGIQKFIAGVTVDEVIEHFDGRFSLALSDDEKYELGQFLRSL